MSGFVFFLFWCIAFCVLGFHFSNILWSLGLVCFLFSPASSPFTQPQLVFSLSYSLSLLSPSLLNQSVSISTSAEQCWFHVAVWQPPHGDSLCLLVILLSCKFYCVLSLLFCLSFNNSEFTFELCSWNEMAREKLVCRAPRSIKETRIWVFWGYCFFLWKKRCNTVYMSTDTSTNHLCCPELSSSILWLIKCSI